MSLKVTASNQGRDVMVSVSGYLDENSVLPAFDGEIHGKLVIDLSALTMINSLGSRRWLKWVKAVRAHGGIVLVQCSTAFIAQVNILHNFLPENVSVESFQVPYRCAKCTHEDHMLFQLGDTQHVPDTRPCAACGAQAELDIVRAKYFHFLNQKAG